MATRRIYSEMLGFEEVARRSTLALLARFRLELVLAVRPWQLEALPRVTSAVRDAGVALSVWPMLGDAVGRWANVHNAPAFAGFVRQVCDVLEASGAPAHDVLFDLEPPFGDAGALAPAAAPVSPRPPPSRLPIVGAVRRVGRALSERTRGIAHLAAGAARPSSAFEASAAALGRAVSDVHARGLSTSTAIWPVVALDPPGERAWQLALGTPVDAIKPRRVSVMMYTSILEGWSHGVVSRRHALALLAAASARTRERWGEAAGISLGCVGAGAFENEPIYRTPRELAEDVATARGSGCDDLSLFDLAGVLARPPAEAWLEAFAFTPRGPEGAGQGSLTPSRRVAAFRVLARVATFALSRRAARASA